EREAAASRSAAPSPGGLGASADGTAATRRGESPVAAPAGDFSTYERPAPRPGVRPIGSINAPGRAKVEGRIRSVEIRPVERSSVLALEISDSTGDLTALFYGRSHIPGIICGARVLLRGPVGIRPDGPVMINPAYELLPPGEDYPAAGEDFS